VQCELHANVPDANPRLAQVWSFKMPCSHCSTPTLRKKSPQTFSLQVPRQASLSPSCRRRILASVETPFPQFSKAPPLSLLPHHDQDGEHEHENSLVALER
jgi:hypothetical protein